VNKYVFFAFVELSILDILSELESNNNEYNLFCQKNNFSLVNVLLICMIMIKLQLLASVDEDELI
jgi:hypothetical protein